MSPRDRLEIISPAGEIKFYELDPARGVTNIGRHPDNDVVIDSPSLAPFYAVLYHQQKPYQLILLGEPKAAARTLNSWEALQVDGYALMVLEGGEPVWMDLGSDADIYLARVEWLGRRANLPRLSVLATILLDQIVNAVGGLGLNAVFLKFGRDAEYEADLLGAQIMAGAGYNPVAFGAGLDEAARALILELLARLEKRKDTDSGFWALGRLGARVPLYGPLDAVVPAEAAGRWIDRLLALDWAPPEKLAFPAAQIGRRTGDRVRDLLARDGVPSASQALTDVFAAVERFSHQQEDDMTGVVLRRKNEPA